MDHHQPTSQGPVPPYEPNPSFAQQPQMQHHDSYNQASIQQYPPQQQQQPYQSPMASPPMTEQKHEYYPAQAAMPQHQASNQMPQQHPPPQQSGYQTSIPLQNLQEAAAPVDCPSCHMRALTKTEHHSGNTTNAWAAVVCLCACLGCIPYLISGLKDVEHKCGHCSILLATWHRSGRTVVHAHA